MGLDVQPLNGAPVLRFAVPIEAYRGKVVGVIAARYSLENLWETIRRTRIGEHGYAAVFDASHHPLLTGKTSNQPLLTASAIVETLNWSVVVCVPRIKAMQPIEALKSDIKANAQRATSQMHQDIQHTAPQIYLMIATMSILTSRLPLRPWNRAHSAAQLMYRYRAASDSRHELPINC